jgi:hypothetical protein
MRATRMQYLLLPLLLLAACDSATEPRLLSVTGVILEAIGDSKQMEANVKGTDRLPTWESLHPEIATITRAGMVTAVSPGTAKVVARIGSETVEGNVVVLPPVNVEIVGAATEPEGDGWERVTLQIRNVGGRGFYRMRFYRESATPGGEPQIIAQWLTDQAMAANQPQISSSMQVPSPAHWVVIYSREPNSVDYRTTACVRLDGPEACPGS